MKTDLSMLPWILSINNKKGFCIVPSFQSFKIVYPFVVHLNIKICYDFFATHLVFEQHV